MRTMMIAMMCVVGLAGVSLAQGDLRHPPARKAVARAEQETRKAEQVYRQELLRIQKALVSELEKAKADAMQRQLLDEANAIQAAIDAARAELDRLEGKPVVHTFTIDAAQSWQPTIEVRKGQKVQIRASGRWIGDTSDPRSTTAGPDGIRKPQGDVYYLEGRIGSGQPVRLDSRFQFVAEVDGMLMLRMNDGNHSNNAGSVTVQIAASP